jgi:hypothetical protein
MTPKDILALVHPVLAIALVYPLVGIVVRLALQTRQRRLDAESRKTIAAQAGPDHLRFGRWLTAAVVGVAWVGLTYAILAKLLGDPAAGSRLGIVALAITIVPIAVGLLLRSRSIQGQLGYAILAFAGILWLGWQPEVFRRDFEWAISHFYYGITVVLLMLIAFLMQRQIYRSLRWRIAHIVLNCVVLLLFLGQAMTGARDLLEIPLSWQTPALSICDFQKLTCPQPKP